MSGNIPFVFFDNAQEMRQPSAFVATIPHGISDLDDLFDAYQKALQFPVYFGRNWDALWDCLGDLSWIPSKAVLIVHEDLPSMNRQLLKKYLTFLVDCVLDWKPGEEHELTVAFPRKYEVEILNLIESGDENHGIEQVE